MKKVSLSLLVSLCLCFPIPVNAQTPTDNYINQLIELGYTELSVSKTFLGRYRILATRDGTTRELVVARNGQLLFDYLDASKRTPSFAAREDDSQTGNPPTSTTVVNDESAGADADPNESSGADVAPIDPVQAERPPEEGDGLVIDGKDEPDREHNPPGQVKKD